VAVWITTLGRQNQPQVLEALTYKGVKLETLTPTVNAIFFIYSLSAQKPKLLFLSTKIIWGILPPPPSYACDIMEFWVFE
jgi:hypothetical protein